MSIKTVTNNYMKLNYIILICLNKNQIFYFMFLQYIYKNIKHI